MYLNQVKMGQVIHHIKKDDYARVVGLKLVGESVVLEVHRLRVTDTETPWHDRLNPEYVFWNLDDVSPLTSREIGNDSSLAVVLRSEPEQLDREV